MSLAPYKTFVAGEVLTAADLNNSFLQILNNPSALISPFTANLDLDGFSMLLDSDGDSYINVAVDDNFLIHLNGADLFNFDGDVASPLNGFDFVAGAAGVRPLILGRGEANVSPAIRPKGSASFVVLEDHNGNEVFKTAAGTASAINEVTVTNAATGTRPRLETTGGDSNIDLALRPKGTGGVVLEDANGNEILKGAASVASAVNELTIQNAATGNQPQIQATGGDTNVGIRLVAKGTGVVSVAGDFDAEQIIRWSGDITPAQITATENNYNPTGLSTANIARISSDAQRAITGLVGGTDGRLLTLVNVGSFEIDLSHDSAGSTAANRFFFPEAGSVLLLPNYALTLWYDATISRWRSLGTVATAASAAEMAAPSNVTTYVPPTRQHIHFGHPKATLTWDGAAGTNIEDYGIGTISDDGVGLWTPTFTTAFSNTNWGFTHGHMDASNATGQYIKVVNATKTTTTGQHRANTNGAADDYLESYTSYFGRL